jgi:hypothetical protein
MTPFNQKTNSPNIPAGWQDRISVVSITQKSGEGLLKAMDADQVQSVVRYAIQESVDFEESEFSTLRKNIDLYYQGYTSLKKVEGRSQVTVTAVRDAVKAVIASIARIFTQTDTVGEFYSDDEEDERLCTDATKYVNSVFWKNGGYKALIMASTDALKAKKGIIKVILANVPYTVHKTQSNLPSEMPEMPEMAGMEIGEMDELEGLLSDDLVTEQNEEEQITTSQKTRLKWELLPVPPEEFFIDSSATCLEDARICGHRRNIPIYEAVAMGYKYDDLIGLAGEDNSTFQTEKDSRRGYARTDDEVVSPADPTSRPILFTEAYMRLDADGDGIAELRRVACGGLNYTVLSDEPVNWLPYAEFSAELQPHVFYPICLGEDLIQDQDAQTALLRSIIDNTALTNSPRTEVNESKVNLDDVKNGAIGAIVRVREMGQIQELTTPFVAGQTLPVLVHLQDVAQSRSGVTKLNQGLDPDALQSTTRVAAQAAVAGSDARIEMMARNIGETGVTSLFLCILRTAIHSIKGQTQIKMPEGFMTVRPEWWHDQLSVKVNVGLGSGGIDEKKAVLSGLIPIQQQIVTQYGPANPVCSWDNMRNTIASLMRLSGVHNTQDYFPYVPPDKIEELDKQMKEAAAQKDKLAMDAQAQQMQIMKSMADAEMAKAQLGFQSKMSDIQSKHQTEVQKLQQQMAEMQTKQVKDMSTALLTDDRERDKMQLQFIIDAITLKMDEKDAARAAAQADQLSQMSKPNGEQLQ